jgi:hypothetical protein
MRPIPPNGASHLIELPPVNSDGLRRSVNRGISSAQTTWNLRSAFNVAALNCSNPKHAEILPAYRSFLTRNARTLTAVNKAVDAEFRKKYGSSYIAKRESYMTSVYNHFALPPTIGHFCDAVMVVGREAGKVPSSELEAFAARSLPNVEVVFDDFYRRYEQYQVDLASWEARYGTKGRTTTSLMAQ